MPASKPGKFSRIFWEGGALAAADNHDIAEGSLLGRVDPEPF